MARDDQNDIGTARTTADGHSRDQSAAGKESTEAASSEKIAPGVVLGEYEVVRQLGTGGMGAVYEAVHPIIGKSAAIKVIHRHLIHNSEFLERFKREARAVNAIGHPNIVDVFSFGEIPGGGAYFVMEHLKGQDLSEYLKKGLPEFSDACRILMETLKAIEAAHASGIVHRDLKPENLFLVGSDSWSSLKVLDFGIAKLEDDGATGSEGMTKTGVMMGTPRYMSPEQARAETVTSATDVYSLGVMAFEVLTGKLPFTSRSATELLMDHIQAPIPDVRSVIPAIPEDLALLVKHMMAKEPSSRPTATQALSRFQYYAGIQHVLTPIPAPFTPPEVVPANPSGQLLSTLPPVAATPSYGLHTPNLDPAIHTPTPMPAHPANVSMHGHQTEKPLGSPRSTKRIALVGVIGSALLAGVVILAATRDDEASTESAETRVELDTSSGAAVPSTAPEPDPDPESEPSVISEVIDAGTATVLAAAANNDETVEFDAAVEPAHAEPDTQAAAATSTLTVFVEARKAVVLIDNQRVPVRRGRAEKTFQAKGTHTIEVRAPRFHVFKRDVEVEGDIDLRPQLRRRKRPTGDTTKPSTDLIEKPFGPK